MGVFVTCIMRPRIIKYSNYSSAVYLLFCAVSRAHSTRPAASLPDPLGECKTDVKWNVECFLFVKNCNISDFVNITVNL